MDGHRLSTRCCFPASGRLAKYRRARRVSEDLVDAGAGRVRLRRRRQGDAGLPARCDVLRPRLERADPSAPRLRVRAGESGPPGADAGLNSREETENRHGFANFPMLNLASAPKSGTPGTPARRRRRGSGLTVAVLRTIARHGMTKGAAFFYAVAVGAAANFVMDYLHHHDNATPVVAHETVTAPEREHTVIAPIVRPEPRALESRTGEPRAEPRAIEPRVPERPTTAALPPVPEVRPLPAPTAPAALPQVPRLPLTNPPAVIDPAAILGSPDPAAETRLDAQFRRATGYRARLLPWPVDKPTFSVPSAVLRGRLQPCCCWWRSPPLDKSVEAMSIPTLPVPSIGNLVSLLLYLDKPAETAGPKDARRGAARAGCTSEASRPRCVPEQGDACALLLVMLFLPTAQCSGLAIIRRPSLSASLPALQPRRTLVRVEQREDASTVAPARSDLRAGRASTGTGSTRGRRRSSCKRFMRGRGSCRRPAAADRLRRWRHLARIARRRGRGATIAVGRSPARRSRPARRLRHAH